MKLKLQPLFLAALVFVILGFVGKETPLEKIIRQLTAFTSTVPIEKVYLQTDKPYYAYGEEIWIKGYVVTAKLNEPSSLSKVLYVELIDKDQFVRKSLKVDIDEGMAAASILLTEVVPSGVYRLRAYTKYMRNFDDSYFFEKYISIGAVDKIETEENASRNKSYSLQFFPEGGQLVYGIRSKVGVKALTDDGKGLNLSGFIQNEKKEKVALFATEHVGMGAFSFTPKTGEKYSAVVTEATGTAKSFLLPIPTSTGYVLSVNLIEDQVRIQMSASEGLLQQGNLFVIGQNNGVVYTSFDVKAEKNSAQILIPKNKFPTGITQFTLFSGENPVAERICFIQNDDALEIGTKVKDGIGITKMPSGISLHVTDKEGDPVMGNFSMSVIDESQVPYSDNDETTIFTHLLLTSDLRGFIEQPNYYFSSSSPERAQHLDYLMLTQGWRRFIWKDVVSGLNPAINYPVEKSVSVSGTILSESNKPLQQAKVMLVSSGPGSTWVLDTLSDSRGRFNFDRLEIPDSTNFIIRAVSANGEKNVKISLDDFAPVSKKSTQGRGISINAYLEQTREMYKEMAKYNRLKQGINIDAVEIKSVLTREQNLAVPHSANATGIADAVVKREALSKESNIFIVLGKIPGVVVRENMIYMSAIKRRSLLNKEQTAIGKQLPMQLFIDGIQIPTDMQPVILSATDVRDLEGIEALTSTYNYSVYGPDAAYGVIHFTTRKGDNMRSAPSTHIVALRNPGLKVADEFYVPDYKDPRTPNSMKDLRSTVYWNPKIQTNNEGNASVSFLNTSKPGMYKVVVEGMDAYGSIGRSVIRYEIKTPQ